MVARFMNGRGRMSAPIILRSAHRLTARTAKPCLLLVEDDQFHVLLLSRWLQADGRVDVLTAQDGDEAIRLLHAQHFDALVTDVNIPGPSGPDVVRMARQIHPAIGTALITADAQAHVETLRRSVAVDEVLHKPLTRERFLRCTQQAIEQGRLRDEQRPHTVLAIGAHPGDAEVGCGGILLSHRQAGDRIVTLAVGGESCGPAGMWRRPDGKLAAHLLGAEVHVIDAKGSRMGTGDDIVAAIGRVLQQVQPTVVYFHSVHDTNGDHRSVAQATQVAVRASSSPALLCYQSLSSTLSFQPTYLVDIAEHLPRKLEALSLYDGGDRRGPTHVDGDLLRCTARYWGRFLDSVAAEPLEVMPPAQ